MINKIIICSNIPGAGKDTVAEYLRDEYNFLNFSFAEPIYSIAKQYFEMKNKDRALLQKIGEAMRSVKDTVWVDYTFNRIKNLEEKTIRSKFSISDLRRKNEYDRAIQEGFFPIRVVCDRDVAIKRIIERDGHCDVSLLDNESESGTRHLPIFEVYNNGTKKEMHKQIDALMQEVGW
jgi:dephospho-CoA kinase